MRHRFHHLRNRLCFLCHILLKYKSQTKSWTSDREVKVNNYVYVFWCIIITGDVHPGRMNSSTPELKTTHSIQQYIGSDDSSSKDCGSVENNVHPGPAGTAFWEGCPSETSMPEIVPHPHQHTIQPGVVDPLSLRCTLNEWTIFLFKCSLFSFSFSVLAFYQPLPKWVTC